MNKFIDGVENVAWWKRLPSIVYVLGAPLAIIAFMGLTIGGMIVISTVEGVASIVFLIVGFFSFRVARNSLVSANRPAKSLAIGGAIAFYALMGMSVDQTGNFIYNKPLDWFCPAETKMERMTNITNPLPGRTDFTQEFNCVDVNGKTLKEIDMFTVIGVRFVEYVFIGYFVYFLAYLTGKKVSHTL